jgi:hypothetical protein
VSSAVHHVAGGALSLPQEELFPGRGIVNRDAFRGWGIQREQQRRQRIELLGWQIESRHAGIRRASADEGTQRLKRARTDILACGECGAAIRAMRIGSVASGAFAGEEFLSFGERTLAKQQRRTQEQ